MSSSNVFQQFGAGLSAWDAPLDARLAFIRRTYLHLTGAIAAFVAVSWMLFTAGIGEMMLSWIAPAPMRWFIVMGGFMLVSWLATSMAHSAKSRGTQYAGLAGYTLAWSVVFAPLLAFATLQFPGSKIVPAAAAITLLTFAGLSAIVLTSKKDFSFLGVGLRVAMLVALGLIIASAIFGWNLGIWFTGAMILVAAGAVLYSTSNVLHRYRTDQHVAGALELFAALAMLFWYVLRLLMQLQRRN